MTELTASLHKGGADIFSSAQLRKFKNTSQIFSEGLTRLSWNHIRIFFKVRFKFGDYLGGW